MAIFLEMHLLSIFRLTGQNLPMPIVWEVLNYLHVN